MASGPKPPDGEPGSAPGSLIRHRWLTAAGTTATVAAMAGGGLLLLRQQPAAGPHRDCGLVPCSATLPRSVTASATGPAAAPGRTRPAPRPARSAGRAVSHAQAAPGGAGLAAGPGQSADHQVRVHYTIRHLRGGAVTGQLVIVNHGGAPVTGWQLRVVLPGDDHYQVGYAASASAGDSLVVTALPGTPALGAGRSARVTFTAEGSTAMPASVTFRDAAAGQPAQAGSPAGLARSGWPSGSGWPGGWRGPQQHGFGGWPAPGPGGWPGAGQGGWPGGH